MQVWDEIIYPLPKSNGETVEVYQRICNFILHFTGRMINYPSYDYS